jgi:hypothetical protein
MGKWCARWASLDTERRRKRQKAMKSERIVTYSHQECLFRTFGSPLGSGSLVDQRFPNTGELTEDPRVAQNKVQYQEGFSLSEFIQAYGTEKK